MQTMTESLRPLLLAALLAAPVAGSAYGPAGHLIAARAAEPLLCLRARAKIAELSDGEDFAELGLWADRIRDQERWRYTAPWHYMNIADGVDIAAFAHPQEGDVLAAIENAAHALADESLGKEARAQALKFLIHFVVDVHQPLHVGRAEDRGGNEVDVTYAGFAGNLHRFWDTEAVRLPQLSNRQYADLLTAPASRFARIDAGSTPVMWAEESLRLRAAVYGFNRRTGVLDEAYLKNAERITRERLIFAAARLANTLNAILCGRQVVESASAEVLQH